MSYLNHFNVSLYWGIWMNTRFQEYFKPALSAIFPHPLYEKNLPYAASTILTFDFLFISPCFVMSGSGRVTSVFHRASPTNYMAVTSLLTQSVSWKTSSQGRCEIVNNCGLAKIVNDMRLSPLSINRWMLWSWAIHFRIICGPILSENEHVKCFLVRDENWFK